MHQEDADKVRQHAKACAVQHGQRHRDEPRGRDEPRRRLEVQDVQGSVARLDEHGPQGDPAGAVTLAGWNVGEGKAQIGSHETPGACHGDGPRGHGCREAVDEVGGYGGESYERDLDQMVHRFLTFLLSFAPAGPILTGPARPWCFR